MFDLKKTEKEKKKLQQKVERVERWVVTSDGDEVWTPCWEGNKLKLHVSILYFREWYVKIAAWGADDYGVERVYYFKENYEKAKEKYEELILEMNSVEDGVSLKWFLNHGYEPF